MALLSARQERLYGELKRALAATSANDLNEWGRAGAARLPKLFMRRVKNLGSLVARVAKGTGKEIADAFAAWRRGGFGTHLGDRTAAGIDAGVATAEQLMGAVTAFGKALFADPKKNAPDVFALALGFYAGSGGLDGNGGIPDADLALGIGWHRSVFTHSIIAGTVVEGAILALADLATVVCEKLPASERDPFWDHLTAAKDRIAGQLAAGASAGIAYHLGVDATLQPAPYHDVPFSAPIEGHQAFMAANAVAEGIDAAHKTAGRRVVEGASKVGDYAIAMSRDGWKRARGLVTGKP